MSKKDWRHKPHEINLIQAGKILDGKPVAVLDSNNLVIPQTYHKGQLADWAGAVFAKQGGFAQCPVLGNVILNRRSGKTTFGHGDYNRIKVIALYGVKNVIEQGALIAEDFSLSNESSHWKSAPVEIDSVEHIVTALIHNDSNGQRMYLHSVIKKQQLALGVSVANCNNVSQKHIGSLMPVFGSNLPQTQSQVKKISPKHPNALTPDDIRKTLQTALRLNRDKSFCQQFLQQQDI